MQSDVIMTQGHRLAYDMLRGTAAMSTLIILVRLHIGERNVDKLGLGFESSGWAAG